MSGLLGPYTGIELYEQLVATRRSHNLPDEWLPGQDSSGELLPQVSALAMNLCETTQDRCTRTKRRPDYLIISIGGNDIEFGNLLREFSLNTTTDNERQEIISRLTENRKRLQENLSTLAHRVLEELNPRETIITEYPDPTMKVTNMNGVERLDYCSDNTPTSTFTFVPRIATPFGYGLSKTESKFAQNHVLSKLNEDLRIFAKQHNWIYASGITSATKGKGFCANPRNFHNYMDSYRRQGTVEKVVIGEFKFGGETSGAMHPNFFGHLRYRDAILKLLD